MNTENDEGEERAATDAQPTIENHNRNRVRRRNKADRDATEEDRVPLVILADSTRAWYDGAVPRIPDADVASGKPNGATPSRGDEDDDPGTKGDANDETAPLMTTTTTANDPFTAREKLKMSVIRGTIANPDLTLGELRLLGCSSEGFVNGTLPPIDAVDGTVMINEEPRAERRFSSS